MRCGTRTKETARALVAGEFCQSIKSSSALSRLFNLASTQRLHISLVVTMQMTQDGMLQPGMWQQVGYHPQVQLEHLPSVL